MVGRIENDASSSTATTMSREVQKPAPVQQVQKVQVKSEQKSSNEDVMPKEKAKDMVDNMNKFLDSATSQLKFQFHEGLNEYYVTVIDSETDEVIREIPSKKLMDIHAAMREFVGLLVDRKI